MTVLLRRAALILAVSAILIVASTIKARACSLALVALIDGSTSLSEDQWNRAVLAHINVLTSDRIGAVAEEDGIMIGVIAFAGTPTVMVPLTMVRSAQEMREALAPLHPETDGRHIQTGDGTAAGTAVMAGVRMIVGSEEAMACERRVIDVATDGDSNAGISTLRARDAAELAGIVINAVTLVTQYNDPSGWARENLITRETDNEDGYVPAGFVMAADTFDDWLRAIVRKVVLEVAGL